MSAEPAPTAVDRGAFDALLVRLGRDGAAPAEVYEQLRQRLIAVFRLHLPIEAETLADEALERLARRLHEGVAVEQVGAYLHGIARLVLLEARDRPQERRAAADALERLPAPPTTMAEEDEIDIDARNALRACFAKLDPESARLILAYYDDDGEGRIRRRQQLAGRLGVSLNALRNRALRLRQQLETCVRARLAGTPVAAPPAAPLAGSGTTAHPSSRDGSAPSATELS